MDALYDAVLGAVALKQVRRTTFQAQIESQALRQSGAVDPSEFVVTGGEPRATFETFDLAGVLAGMSVSAGLPISAGTITIPWNRRANGGTFAGGTNNFTLTGSNGLACPTSFGASQSDEGAVAEIELIFRSTDGQTAPVAAAVNQSLGAQAFSSAYAMGPAYVNGVQLTQVESLRVETGIRVVAQKFDGGVFPVFLFIQERNPMISITFNNLDALSTYGPLFSALPGALAVYFRAKSAGGTFVADASAAHVKFSFAAGITEIQSAEGQGTGNATASIRAKGLALVASAASTIP